MDKFWNFAEDDGANELRLDGPISTDTWWGDEVTPAQFRADLAAHPGDITVWINSPGGDVFAASSIYTALKEHDGRVTVKIEALAASAASIVAMAGDEVLIAPTAFLMIHRASTVALGNSDEMRHAAKELDEVDNAIAAVYAEKTGLPQEKCLHMMEAETWMNAQSALENGFADAILYQAAPEPEAEPEESEASPAPAARSARLFVASCNADALLRRIAAMTPAPAPAPEPEPEPDNTDTRRRIALRMKFINDQLKEGN